MEAAIAKSRQYGSFNLCHLVRLAHSERTLCQDDMLYKNVKYNHYFVTARAHVRCKNRSNRDSINLEKSTDGQYRV